MRTISPFSLASRPDRSGKMVSMLVALSLAACAAGAADAAVTVTFQEVGSDVVARTTGSLDLAGLTLLPDSYYLQAGVQGSDGYVGTGAGSHRFSDDPFTIQDAYSGLIGLAASGSGAFTYADAGSGDGFALNASFFGSPYVFVPTGYVSGTVLRSSATFLGQTIASLGLTVGSYVYSSSTDSVTVNVSGDVAAVPEPTSWALMLAGFGAIGGAMRSRRKATVGFG